MKTARPNSLITYGQNIFRLYDDQQVSLRALYGNDRYVVARGWQHKHKLVDGFTKKYNATKMVYFETFTNVHEAIAREKQLKGWSRKKKEALIQKVNPEWRDVYKEAIR